MKAFEITEAGKEALLSKRFQMVRVNYANPDMVRAWYCRPIRPSHTRMSLRLQQPLRSVIVRPVSQVMSVVQVGHTGDLKAVVRACTTVDRHLGDLLETVEKMGGRWLVSSDHGNADDMVQARSGIDGTTRVVLGTAAASPALDDVTARAEAGSITDIDGPMCRVDDAAEAGTRCFATPAAACCCRELPAEFIQTCNCLCVAT